MPQFQPGISGNPQGKPKGALNKRTQLGNLLEPHAEALINKTIELALSGDMMALRLCIERLIPKAKDTTARISMPDLTTTPYNKIMPELLRTLAGQELSITDIRSLADIYRAQDTSEEDKRMQEDIAEMRARLVEQYRREY